MLAISSYPYYVSIFMFSMSGDFRYNIRMLTCAYVCPLLLLARRTRRGAAKPVVERPAQPVTSAGDLHPGQLS
jgi:hypothetical protein